MWLINKLEDPHLVVAFQKFCGIQGLYDKSIGDNSASHGYNTGGGEVILIGGVASDCSYLTFSEGDVNGDVNANSRQKGQSGETNGHNLYNGLNGHLRESQNGHNEKQCYVANSNAQNGHSTFHSNKMEAYGWKITNYFWYYIFSFGASLGNEVFYITFLPFMVWNYDSYVIRRACAFWALYMYLGQATKDIMKIPRPPSPPVIRLERRYALEYGLPSTHAMVGAGLPFSIYFLSVNRYQMPWEIGLAICVIWCSLVCFSRIYLGMHSFLDVLAGLAYVFALMPPFFMLCDACDDFALNHWLGPFVSVLLPLAVCIFYPTLDKWSTARGDTTLILAVVSGVYIASYFNVKYGYIIPSPVDPPYPFPLETDDIGLHLLRFIVGVVVLGVTREIMKAMSYGLVCWFLKVNKKDLKQQQRLCVELPYKFITYSFIGFNSLFTVPIIHSYLGIVRAAFHYEA